MNIIEIENQRCCCYSDMYDCPNNHVGAMDRCKVRELAKFASRVHINTDRAKGWADVLMVGPDYFKVFWGNGFAKAPFKDIDKIETL